MERMAGAVGDDMTDDRMPDEREIADGVENLVANELVLEAQGVQDPGVADDDRILQRPAEGQAVLAQRLDFLQEPEGAGRRNALGETLFGNPLGPRLVAEQRVIE